MTARRWGSSRVGSGRRRRIALTLKGWRWATSQGHAIPCELHGVARCTACMDPARVAESDWPLEADLQGIERRRGSK